MGNLLRVSVLAPGDVLRDFGAGALVRVERAASEAGAYAEIATAAVVDDTYSYEVWDADGAATSWYRNRYSRATPTLPAHYSGYSDPFSPEAPPAYATLDDLLLTMSQSVANSRWLANAEAKLREATIDIDREIGYSALRTTGSRIYTWSGRDRDVLHVHGGIISLDTVEIRLATGGSWTTLDVEDVGWFLEGDLGDPGADDGVFYHLRLSDVAAYSTFPRGIRQGVRLTGVLGGNPESRKAACVAWARQKISLDPSNPGSIQSGPEDFGAVVNFDKWPRAVYDLITSERRRFWCHVR